MPGDSTTVGWVAAYVSADMLLFGAVCLIAATAVIFLDWVLLTTQGRSLMDMTHGGKEGVLNAALWCVGAGLVGLLSAALDIVQPNIQAAVAVAIGWPMILNRLIESSTATVQAPTMERREE